MAARNVIIRIARPADAERMAEVDRQSWPASLATTTEEFRARIGIYPQGQLVAELDGGIVGTAAAQRITAAFLEHNGHRYDLLTDTNRLQRSHHARGEIYQLIGVGVLPQLRGENLGRQVVDRQIEQARNLPGVRRIVGFTRPALYRRHQQMPIEEYVVRRDEKGRPFDPVLAFHLEAGARVVSIQPDFRPADSESCGYGVLIEYPCEWAASERVAKHG